MLMRKPELLLFSGEFLKDKVITGRDNGIIILNIEEADEAERVKHNWLGERYRTLMAFSARKGNYYWEVLLKNSDMLGK